MHASPTIHGGTSDIQHEMIAKALGLQVSTKGAGSGLLRL
jgi:hypothetical protein